METKSKHTPGPWTLQPIGDETECNILGSRRELIATVSDNDANVIAAAPELLRLVKQYRQEAIDQGAEPSDLAEIDTVLKAAGEKV